MINPSKSFETLFTLPFLINLKNFPICKMYEVNHFTCFFSKRTPTMSQSDDLRLSNSLEQAVGSQSKSDKIAIILDIEPFKH